MKTCNGILIILIAAQLFLFCLFIQDTESRPPNPFYIGRDDPAPVDCIESLITHRAELVAEIATEIAILDQLIAELQ